MITYETLNMYLEKARTALEEIKMEIGKQSVVLEELKEKRLIITGQVATLENLMEADPVVEVPIAGDIEEHFEGRDATPGGLPEEEVYEKRQEDTYLAEAEEMIEAVDEHNRE